MQQFSKINRKKGLMAVAAVLLMLCVAFSPAFMSESSDAAATNAGTATVSIKPGQTWTWTPTFSDGVGTVSLFVNGSSSDMPSDATSTTTTNASVSSGKVTVTIPSNYSEAHYFLYVKATTTQPAQVAHYKITFNLNNSLTASVNSVVAKVGTKITDITFSATGGSAITKATVSPTLPAGLSISNSGVISGTPTAYTAQTPYTVTATLANGNTATGTVSIGAFTNITASNYTVYAIKSTTAVTVPGVSMPTGTLLDSMTVTATMGNTEISGFTVGTATSGLTVEKTTGKVSGTPSATGTFKFTEEYTATAATGGSTATRTVTIVVEEKVGISGSSSFNSFAGHSDSVTLTKSGPSNVKWTIDKITKGGTQITSGTDFTSFTVNGGVLTSSTATTAGKYVVTVRATSTNSTTTTSEATGTSPSNNYATKDINVTVSAAISIYTSTNALDFYMTTAGEPYDALKFTSNISGATFKIEAASTDTATSANVSVASDGTVTPGATHLAVGDYKITVKASDPNNSYNTNTVVLNVHVKNVLNFTNEPSAGSITS